MSELLGEQGLTSPVSTWW